MSQLSQVNAAKSCVDPDGVTVPNGNFFGLPHTVDEAQIVLLPVPWDVTTSYGGGAAAGPQAILEASDQLDWYDFDLPQAWQVGYGTVPIDAQLYAKNQGLRQLAMGVIERLTAGVPQTDPVVMADLAIANQACTELNHWVYQQADTMLSQGKPIGVVGGDHSVPLGYLRALSERHSSFGILQIDAHADLRVAYEGFLYSHGSIMHNTLELPSIHHLVQVGVRDLCTAEMDRIQQDPRITLFDDWQLKTNQFHNISWHQQCQTILAALPESIYISFDIDGLSPEFCPHTGTPVPGGLTFNQAIYLLQCLVKSGRTIIGFDLCEVAPGPTDEWDGNVGARLLYKLCNLMYRSQLNTSETHHV